MSKAVNMALHGVSREDSTQESQKNNFETRILSRAVVLHTLCDPSLRNVDTDKDIISKIRNKDDYLTAPRNSIVCRLIDDGKGRIETSDYVSFPFFSSHFSLPIKAGEQIWVFFERTDSLSDRPYWMSRISGPLFVEDANFTHLERRNQNTDPKSSQNNLDDGSGNYDSPRKLKFQNGNPDTPELTSLGGDDEKYDDIIKSSKEADQVTFEPVPRITKRPGDLVLQGSNNTSIVLGHGDAWDLQNRPTDKTAQSVTGLDLQSVSAGTIDIVSGRGRIFKSKKDEALENRNIGPDKSTKPLIVENQFGFEVDKNIVTQQDEATAKKKGNINSNPQEGDPDLLLDASRILLSTNMEVDKSFGTGLDGVNKRFDTPIADLTGPSIVSKSEHIRIVARKTSIQKTTSSEPKEIKDFPENGSIRIVKEGNPKEDLASLTMEKDGVVHIGGSKIFFGRSQADGGDGQGPGPGGSQPYIKYSELEKLLNGAFTDIKTFATSLQANFNINTTPGFGAPNPALIASAVGECQNLMTAMDSRIKQIKNIQSKRIFGE